MTAAPMIVMCKGTPMQSQVLSAKSAGGHTDQLKPDIGVNVDQKGQNTGPERRPDLR